MSSSNYLPAQSINSYNPYLPYQYQPPFTPSQQYTPYVNNYQQQYQAQPSAARNTPFYRQQQQQQHPRARQQTTTPAADVEHYTSVLATADVTIDYTASPVENAWPLEMYTPQFALIAPRGDMPGFSYSYIHGGALPVQQVHTANSNQ